MSNLIKEWAFSIGVGSLLISTLMLCSCDVATGSKAVQVPDHWVILDPGDAELVDGRYSWDFELNRIGTYDIQVVTADALPSPAPVARIEVEDQQTGGELTENYVTDAGIVTQFKPSVSFEHTGLHTLAIELDAPFEQVRIIPNFKNAFSSGKYDAKWQAMHNSPEKRAALDWFKQARFGMFIHWGLYSQAGGSWKGTKIEDSGFPGPGVAEWLMFKFRIPRDEYAGLAKSFNPDRSFAQNIARLARDAGMKYVVITAKHHDGFALFDSACSEFDMVDATPYEADAIKELYDACLAEGLEFGVYYSHGNDWQDGADGNYANVKQRNDAMGIYTHAQGKNLWDPSPNTLDEYLESKAYPQIAELLKLMPRLRLIWFDGEGFITEDQSFRFYQMIYDINPNVLVNRRVGYEFGDYLDAGDNVVPSADAKLTKHWETCGTTNNSWGFKAHDHDWKDTKELLYWFIDIASKGGNYLLNIGPDGKGHVPRESAKHLREVGDWLEVNGEAIYGTTRWKIIHEGSEETVLAGTGHRAAKGFNRDFSPGEFWFTFRKNPAGEKVYAISLARAGESARIRSLNKAAGKIHSVRRLGSDRAVNWEQTTTELVIDTSEWDTGDNGFVVEVSF